MTVLVALRWAQNELSALSDAPSLDAERLLLQVVERTETAWLHAHPEESLSSAEDKLFRKRVTERATGKPLAYILGEWEFYGRPFYVTPDVLIPRPETEDLVAAALAYVASHPVQTIADIGTGSGCIAVTLALALPHLHILATDISPAALVVAKKNAQRHGVLDQIEFLEGDMLSPLQGRLVDLIVSNPPYIPTAELAKAGRARDTRGLTFEPYSALDGGPDGQQFVNQIKNAGVPAFVEGTGGDIVSFSIP